MKGFPRVLGAVDGTFIPCRTPAHKEPSTYINRKGGISMTLQGICDANKLFLDVFIGFPSKTHDSRILRESFIYNELQQICSDGDYHLVGDSAYPLLPFLMTPFKNIGHLSASQKRFNTKLCGTRVIIEQTFGLLKQRFRQLLHEVDFHTVDKICKFSLACCVLHNMCVLENDCDPFDDAEMPPQVYGNDGGAPHVPDVHLRAQGKRKRDAIMNNF